MCVKLVLLLESTLCCIGYWRMDKEALKQSLFDAIQRLENNGLIDHHFRECYLLKEESGPRFFIDLISDFSTDVRKVVKQMEKTLYSSLPILLTCLILCFLGVGCHCKIVSLSSVIDRNQPLVDFSEMNELCIKLKGSAACIGACRISAVCSELRHAIGNKSKEGCLQVLSNIKHETKNLKSRLNDILRVEQELISRDG